MRAVVRVAAHLVCILCLASNVATAAEAWLEESEGSRALEWVRRENARTEERLLSDPRFARYQREALKIEQDPGQLPAATPFDGWIVGRSVYHLWTGPDHPRGLLRRTTLSSYESPAPAWEAVLDIDALSQREQRNWRLKQLECNGLPRPRCMISLSDGGSEALVYRELDPEAKSFVKEGFVLDVPVRGGFVVWADADTLLVSTTEAGGEATKYGFPATVRLWQRGSALSAAEVVHRGDANTLVVDEKAFFDTDGRRILLVRDTGAESGFRHWIADARGAKRPVEFPPGYASVALHKGQWIFVLNRDWSVGGALWKAGTVVAVNGEPARDSAPRVTQIYAPDSSEAIFGVQATMNGVLLFGFANIQGRLVAGTFESGRWKTQAVALPTTGSVSLGMVPAFDSDVAYVRYEGFLQPPTLYAVNPASGEFRVSKKVPEQFNSEGLIAEQRLVKSVDGTEVPYFLIRRRSLELNGTAPTLLYGYGAHGSVEHPRYSGVLGRLWLEEGGVYAVANIRGGGEFGERWHRAATKANKQKSYDDFIAVSQDLIRTGVTSPAHLGIRGMSSGGLLMGVVLNQRPELFNAAVVEVPLLDLFRFDLLQGKDGFANEFGSASIPEERAVLERTSPYQNLRKRLDYPTPLLITSTADDRVRPAQARRFAARLQDLQLPYLFYETAEGGHEVAVDARDKAKVDALIFTYLAQRLAMPGKRKFTVEDSIAWVDVLPFGNPTGLPQDAQVALYAPDGRKFVVHTTTGDLREGVNVERLLLFNARSVAELRRQSALEQGTPLAEIRVREDWAGIGHVRWVSSTEIAFIAQGDNARAQVFITDMKGVSTQVTHASTDVVSFDIAGDTVAYYAHIPLVSSQAVNIAATGIYDAVIPDNERDTPIRLHVASRTGGDPVAIDTPAVRLAPSFQNIWISPSGRYAVTFTPAVNAPASWAAYQVPRYELFGYTADRVRSDPTSWDLGLRTRYQLVDLKRLTARPLLDAPAGYLSLNGAPAEVSWSKDETSVVVSNTFLPLDLDMPQSRADRARLPGVVRVGLESGQVALIAWEPGAQNGLPRVPERVLMRTPRVVMKQSQAMRPMLVLDDPQCRCEARVFDPNPQADSLELASMEEFRWTDDNNIAWKGGLMLPPHASRDIRYPLVIQTHGYFKDEFLIDGPRRTTTAMAAQALASAGIAVLQVEDNREALTLDEREGPLYAEGLYAAIRALDAQGIIDASNVGLIGFSRTGYHAVHLLARHPRALKAVTISDALQAGYMGDLMLTNTSPDMSAQIRKLTGGAALGSDRGDWFARNPLYKLSSIDTAVRLEANGPSSVLGLWETFSVLKSAGKPVDFIYFPTGSHVLKKPAERWASQGGNVDWFRFWLQGYEDPRADKEDQYRRWRQMRQLAAADNAGGG